ncbi:MAG TPA: vanadium-dependent haloperoxidase [Terriglobales bacterium]|nr:vanadium-dependent haloperoxidase [Terriglobales bacterium]
MRAAEREFEAPGEPELANGDERRYPNFIGNFSKGLPHNPIGAVDPAAYRALQAGLRAAASAALEAVPLGGTVKLVNPMAGMAFDLEGRDIQKWAAPPAPALASAQRAAEMVELYWMALCREVAFTDYAAHPLALAAARELGGLTAFDGPRAGGRVTPATLFRGATAGDPVGPYVSQLFLTPFAYGQYLLDGRITTFAQGADYLTDPASWLACQNGQGPFPPPALDPEPRYFRNGRDIAAYVHSDQACEAFYNAGLRLYALNAPANPGNPYLQLRTQLPFATFGIPHFLTLQAEAALRAVKAVFYQKWFVHRTLRPEAFGGLVQAVMTRHADFPLHPTVLNSEAAAAVFAKFGSYLHPQAFPEGCPQHPSYTQAHGGVAGACATVLKAAFDGSAPWAALDGAGLKVASADGLALEDYAGADGGLATVNGEVNKLCGNIALARNFAGVHWRSDYVQGLLLGEAMALTVLADQRRTYGEAFTGFEITKFDGAKVAV